MIWAVIFILLTDSSCISQYLYVTESLCYTSITTAVWWKNRDVAASRFASVFIQNNHFFVLFTRCLSPSPAKFDLANLNLNYIIKLFNSGLNLLL